MQPRNRLNDDTARFLSELRALRDLAGLGHAELAARAHYPSDLLQAAEAGPTLPDLPVLAAYVRGCGGTPADWEDRWRWLTSGMPAAALPGIGLPGSGLAGSGVPGSGVPGSGLPGSDVAGSGTPGPGLPGSGTPGSGAAGSGLPVRIAGTSVAAEAGARAGSSNIAPDPRDRMRIIAALNARASEPSVRPGKPTAVSRPGESLFQPAPGGSVFQPAGELPFRPVPAQPASGTSLPAASSPAAAGNVSSIAEARTARAGSASVTSLTAPAGQPPAEGAVSNESAFEPNGGSSARHGHESASAGGPASTADASGGATTSTARGPHETSRPRAAGPARADASARAVTSGQHGHHSAMPKTTKIALTVGALLVIVAVLVVAIS